MLGPPYDKLIYENEKLISNTPPAVIGVGGRGCCLPGLLPPRLCPNPLPAGAPGDRSQLAHGPPARPAGWPGRRWRPGWAGGPAGLVLDRHGPEMGIQAPFRGFLDAILDQICRTRLKKVNICDFQLQKWNFHRFWDAILNQICRTRLKKVKFCDF